MISNVFKKSLFVSVLCFFSSVYCAPTREEIVEEIAHIRATAQQLKDCTNPVARYYLDRVNEAAVLDATTGKFDYVKKYLAMCTAFSASKAMGIDMILLTKENAPKTYEFIAQTAEKLGFQVIPLVYLAANERFFNAMAGGILHSVSVVVLGEKIIKEAPSLEALEFLIAHELSHIKNYHPIKMGIAAAVTGVAIDKIFQYFKVRQISWFYWPTYFNKYGIRVQTGVHVETRFIVPYLNWISKGLLTAGMIAWYKRIIERDADMTAAHSVGAHGGAALFTLFKEKFDHDEQDYAILQVELAKTSLKNSRIFQARIAVYKAYDAILKVLSKPFRTHPTHDQRISYLEELAQEQEKANAAVNSVDNAVVA